ncbi:hypothetical protein BDA96_06G081300 [Sorghum bicolor]|uniref:Transcription repressor n=2 Tax=Sorghum bicolor TaxID=4558 RepID=A0A921QPZ2_SORBI|nr:transcription repressor OFP13 isoform X2 [Sorghum bicolor]KAG0525722.1 hypothetical protein BDA96_06G081300 [Sorghum bicolor]KXG26269.1 hypothetical protein SORBI_3006G073800 [Sorghum bicolor]|eukprot:XP_021319600.1 transcription repressor OFP13 isoform X2 [Sorghum bicolor]
MPPSLHPPHLHFHKLKRRRHHPAAMAKKSLAAILYKFRDVHARPPSAASPPAPSTPSAHYAQRCYPPPPSAWPWPSCRHPRTSSFRGPKDDDAAVFRTLNSVYDTTSEQFLRRSSSIDVAACVDRSPLSLLGEAVAVAEQVDEEDKETELRETAVVRGMRSERLFFEPAGAEFLPKKQGVTPARGKNEAATAAVAVAGVNSEEPATTDAPRDRDESAAEAVAAKGSSAVVVTVESKDPYGDFRASMAEMVAAHGLRDWEALEELLAWYLKLNAKGVHAAIVGAFIDLLVTMQPQASSPPSLPSQSPSSSCITFEEYSSATFDEEDGKS